MPKRFHSFHAPPQQQLLPSTKRSAQPASTAFRKNLARAARDAALRARSIPTSKLVLLTVLCLAAVLLCCRLAFTPQRMRIGSLDLRPTTYACPISKTPHFFAQQVLSTATFVARVRHIGTTPGFLALRIEELYRGPLRAPQWRLVVSDSHAVSCELGDVSERPKDHTDWLLVGGNLSHGNAPRDVPPALLGSPGDFSFVSPIKMPASRRRFHTRQNSSEDSGVPEMVWMAPWHALAKEVAEYIARDKGDSTIWWRQNRPPPEFTHAIARLKKESENGRLHPAVDREMLPSNLSASEWWLRGGVSLIAACKDRTATLLQALPSWLAVEGVNEVVLVDWSSDPPIMSELVSYLLQDRRISLVRVNGQSEWILSRAYNLAAQFARFSRIIKVDCDTMLEPDFVKAHAMRRDTFFAGNWRQLKPGASNELHTNGLLFAQRDDFLAAGGFDERITTYGWDDSDIAERLSKVQQSKSILYSKVKHILHPASLRVINQGRHSVLPPSSPHAAAVEIQRNRLLLTKFNLPQWRASSTHTLWNTARLSNTSAIVGPELSGISEVRGVVFVISSANEVTSASALVSDSDADDVAKRAIRLILRRLGVPLLSKSLTLDFYKTLVEKVANPDKYAEVLLSLRGGCGSRLMAHSAITGAVSKERLTKDGRKRNLQLVHPPQPYADWRVQELWQSSSSECSCNFSDVFEAKNEEVIPAWIDASNPIHVIPLMHLRQPPTEVVALLRSFNTKSREKNISEDVVKWRIEGNDSGRTNFPGHRILIDDLACDASPKLASQEHRNYIRQSLRELSLTKSFAESIESSLASRSMTVLDSSMLSPTRWSHVLATEAGRLRAVFATSELIAMSSRWSLTSSHQGGLVHSLAARATSLMIAMHLGRLSGDEKSRFGIPKDVEKLVTAISRRIDRLFLGCPQPAFSYMDAYPELAVIVAGFISAGMCL